MNHRHPTPEERLTLLRLTEDCGIPEVLRVLGGIVASEHPDLHQGTHYRSILLRVAQRFSEDIQTYPN